MTFSQYIQKFANFFRPAASSPLLSIVVVVFNMQREAPRTLFSLSTAYQQGVSEADYEVVVVENGSSKPLAVEELAQFGPNFRYLWIDNASPSPAAAINRGVAQSRAAFVGIMIDGARIATPGVVYLALQSLQRFKRAVVGTVGFHLGPDTQMYSLQHGYNQIAEDELLASIDWRHHGYRLFNISALAGSSPRGWLDTINESNLIFMERMLFNELGGFDERFSLPGGGIVNLDFYRRACDLPNSTLLTLLSEATFHQIHGGVMTNQPATELPKRLQTYDEEHRLIRGTYFEKSSRIPVLFGPIRPEIIPWLHKSCDLIARTREPTPVPSKSEVAIPATMSMSDNADPASLQPGDKHYRAYVGRVENYDVVSALQFNLLTLLGLREQHYLLDLGCGSLRGGRLFIPYLQSGHYFGIEPNEWLIQEGIAHEIGMEQIALKQPCFAHNDDFNLDVFGSDAHFDFILAQSIFSHAGPSQIRHCLASARKALKSSGLLIATFGERTEDQAVDEWVYPGLNFYRWSAFAQYCAEAGLHCRKLDWPHPQQTWFVAAISLQRLEAVAATGVDFLPDDLVLTDMRIQERDAGRISGGFYRVWQARNASLEIKST
ncbi:MAG: glycosyltransferase [Candidatus Competibacteraceae bacterium]|nr:glycosyltransferase [Candidatus Competibacteraceae bacterium]